MYAIVLTGGKQYKVKEGGVIEVEKLVVPEDKQVVLDKVLLVQDKEKLSIGKPYVEGAKVVCEFIGEKKGKKVIALKFRRRKDSRTKIGHRQKFTRLKVKEVSYGA